MGLLSSIASIAAPIAGTILGGPAGGAIGGAIGGLLSSRDTPSSVTATNQQKLDPRMDAMLWGKNGSGGLLSKYQSYLDQPQSQALQNFGTAAGDYLNNYGAGTMQQVQGAANGLMQPKDAKMADLLGYAVGNQVQAPSQNNIDLTGSYQNLLSGGDTSKLMNSLQAGNALAGAQFHQNQADLTDNLQRNILPGIRSNSVLAGQYGGSRQGVAEGLAISDLTKQMSNSNTQFGLGATAANSSALANAYENGQNRALSATQGLGAQQYGVASQNANTKNQAEFMNVNNLWDASKTNAAVTNGMTQANNQAAVAGAGLLSGLMGQAYGTAQNADNAGINRAQQVNGLLAPYLGANSSSTNTQPLFQSTAGNMLGGAMSGGLLSGLMGGGTSSTGAGMGSIFDLFGKNSTFGNYGA